MRVSGRRWLRPLLIVVAVLIVVWVVLGYLVIIDPTTNKPRNVDAVVVLSPPDEAGSLDTGIGLVKAGHAKNIVVFSPTSRADNSLCQIGGRGLTKSQITCVTDGSGGIRGQAQRVSKIAAQKRWTSMLVVAPTYRISRAKSLISRCYRGTVLMVEGAHGVGWVHWVSQFFYESAAQVKSLVERSC